MPITRRITRPRRTPSTFVIVWLVLEFGAAQIIVGAQNCFSDQPMIANLRGKVQADQQAIRWVNPNLTAQELTDWANQADAEGRAILPQKVDDLIGVLLGRISDTILTSPEAALKPATIAGVYLPNGIGSAWYRSG